MCARVIYRYDFKGEPVMFLCTENGYTEYREKDKPITYETFPCQCKECKEESERNAFSYDKSNIKLRYYNQWNQEVDTVISELRSSSTVDEVRMYAMQYIEGDMSDIKLVCNGVVLREGEKTLGECKISKTAVIKASLMTAADYSVVDQPARASAASPTSNIGFHENKCFKGLD